MGFKCRISIYDMELRDVFGKRGLKSHKGDFGRVLVVGGSDKYSGAPALAGMAALRSGADLVVIASPRRAADIIASFSPDFITYPLKGDYLEYGHFGEIESLIEKADSVVFGNGLGEKSGRFCKKMFETKKPCVVDGDALKFVKGSLGKNFLLTPHAKEFEILTGEKPKKELVKKYAQKLECAILLKGHVDLISDGKHIFENRTGNPYMTKGGTGDILAGICGALLARNLSPFESGKLGAYISGKAGDLAAKDFKESLLATDVIKYIRKVI